MSQNNIRQLLKEHPIVPVVSFSNAESVENTIDQLIEKDIHCIEITLRNEHAFECVQKAKGLKRSNFCIGIGTVSSKEHISRAVELEVDFMVSPGINSQLAPHFEQSLIPFIPGIATPSELILGKQYGWDTFKFFPANLFGGIEALRSYSKVFPDIKFCPTGGINEDNYREFLKLENVLSVGGSWVL